MEEIARVYAKSLFEVAKEKGSLDVVREQLGQFSEALSGNPELSTFFFSPYFSTTEKKEGLEKAVSGADPTVLNILELLLENHRMPAIHRLRREYDRLWDQENKLLPVDITSAVALDEDVVRRLGDQIGEQTGRKVQLNAHVDPDVLGGIILRVGNQILDASIRNRLDQLRRSVAKA
ncbi:ATP synthase F1 subunit delta [Paraconexibacter antarcticus]|uniref:ATP synthase subunit delta n=1 Tax=Paraconexibacter antarcticus TaxID=2949664 RepID=A0ABY5DV13_9ACTN|nr:ATP synthase F1 subunit delta [Paraconexibacter antarcticus]UTI65840.1 ATP synthase F1 subunit delta [Paraconexibacter antarcticus]